MGTRALNILGLLLVTITCTVQAQTRVPYFQAGGALSCTGNCTTQSVNLGSGAFISNALPVSNETAAGTSGQMQVNSANTFVGAFTTNTTSGLLGLYTSSNGPGVLWFPQNISQLNTANPFVGVGANGVGNYFNIWANSNASFTGCPASPTANPAPNLSGMCLSVSGGSDMLVTGSTDPVFSIQSSSTQAGAAFAEFSAINFQNWRIDEGITDNGNTANCTDAISPVGPCAFIDVTPPTTGPSYPLCISGFDASLAQATYTCMTPTSSFLSVGSPAVKYLTASNTSGPVTTTLGDSVSASSITNIQGGSAVNTKANGVPILTGFTGTSGSIGGGALLAGACTNGTVSITGATTAMVATTSPVADPGTSITWESFVSAANTITVRVCALIAATPTATTYNVRVLK